MPSRPAILSISSMKTIPDSSTRRIASLMAASMSISRLASSCASASSASGTGMRVFFVFFGMMFWKRSRSPCSTSSMPCGVITSIMGDAGRVSSISTVRSSSFPSRSMRRSFSRVADSSAVGAARSVSPPTAWMRRSMRTGGSSRSSRRSSASSRARTRTFSFSSSRTRLTAISVRSRMIDSTSRPT